MVEVVCAEVVELGDDLAYFAVRHGKECLVSRVGEVRSGFEVVGGDGDSMVVVGSEGEVSDTDRASAFPEIGRRKAEGMTRLSASCLPSRDRSFP